MGEADDKADSGRRCLTTLVLHDSVGDIAGARFEFNIPTPV
jgi:hypothetical protein